MKIFIGKPYITKPNDSVIRLNSDITSDDNNPIFNHTLYFETEAKYEKALCVDRIDAFVLGLLSSAMHLGYDIVSNEIISERIKYQLETYYIPVVSRNFKDLHKIKLIVSSTNIPYPNKDGAVTGNSGGVDSFYSILKYKNSAYTGRKLTHIIYDNVCTEDYDEKRMRKDFARESVSKKHIAEELDLEFIEMFTNLFSFYKFPGYVFNYFFTSSYTSCVYALQGLFSTFYFSSGVQIEDFSMNESRICDAAYFDIFTVDCISSESLKVYSSGAEVGRFEKTRYIADNPVVQKYLQVDSIEDNGKSKLNCGKCFKCLRTMSTLYVLGKLDKFEAVFDMTYFYKNRQKAFAKLMAGDHSRVVTAEIFKKLKRNRDITGAYYMYYFIYHILYTAKNKMSHYKSLKYLYYKTGIAERVHRRNGMKTVLDEYYEKYGKIE